jgi:hypothetical protein
MDSRWPRIGEYRIPPPYPNGGEQHRVFRDAFLVLRRRIELFASLPVDSLSTLALKRELDGIGRRRRAAVPRIRSAWTASLSGIPKLCSLLRFAD